MFPSTSSRDRMPPKCSPRVEAGASPAKIASQVVLVKNGFQFIGRIAHYVKINGTWHDATFFSKGSPHELGA
jgi:RimJ/RimL family protein N-acetyltransferase